MDLKAFRSLSYGLYIITSVDKDGRKVGCIANTFQQVASEPALVSVSLNKKNSTTKAIEETGVYGVTALSQNTTMDFIARFGFKSSYEIDKFEGVDFSIAENGAPLVKTDSVAVFAVDVKSTLDASTHIMFMGEAVDAEVTSDDTPLTYSYYHEVLKGKTPPRAATYNEGADNSAASNADSPSSVGACSASTDPFATVTKMESVEANPPVEGMPHYGWQCTLCGHIIDVEELPADFKCPLCGMGREFFERVLLD